MTPYQIKQWLGAHGFLHIGRYSVKGPVRITFLKASMRVELRLKTPYQKFILGKKFTTTHERVSAARFARVYIDAEGSLRGLGFESSPVLNEVVYLNA